MRIGAIVRRRSGARRLHALQEQSPLRRVDPRVKVLLSLLLSLAIMLPLSRLLVALVLYAVLLAWGGLLPIAGRLLWRLKWAFLILFVVDWLLVSLHLAILVSLRIVLLSGSFALLFATTTPEEFRLALQWARLPHRYAFSLGVTVQSLALIEGEWRSLIEAQQARGAWTPPTGWRHLGQTVRDLVALAVPAVVMTAHRAWSITEAAYARGFDSPARQPYRRLRMTGADWALLIGALVAAAGLAAWR